MVIDIMIYCGNVFLICIIITVMFAWQREKRENDKKTKEIMMYQAYETSLQISIQKMRIQQHNFKNQMGTMLGMHITTESYEELVKRQRKYYGILARDNKDCSIVTQCEEPILAGFLYYKLNEIKSKGMEIEYSVHVSSKEYCISKNKIVEILGILIDNAVEYSESHSEKSAIKLSVYEEEKLVIRCLNRAEYFSQEQIKKFFQKGYSTKGAERGLGLYSVRQYVKSNGEIIVSNRNIDEENWIEFIVNIEKKDCTVKK